MAASVVKRKDKVFQNIDENDKEIKNIKEKMNDLEDSVSKLTIICVSRMRQEHLKKQYSNK